MMPNIIAPSILAANLAKLGEEVNSVLAAGADWIHIDVMDNHYVPNLTFGPIICECLRKEGIQAPLDVHLMVEPVDDLIQAFAKAGASSILIHPEATKHLDRSLQLILDMNCVAGVVLNPATSLSVLEHIWDKISIILLMTVNPGFGGQTFIPAMMSKIAKTAELIARQNKPIRLAVDGGVSLTNIAAIHRAGADTFIIGTHLFKTANYGQTIQAMRQKIANGS